MPASKIKNVKYLGKHRTVDITVDSKDHIYYANGIATSNSHAVAYAVTGYWTAWVKSHLPLHYVCAWLRNSKNEQKPLEEIRNVVSESRRLRIPLYPPSLINLPKTDFFVRNKAVYFGLDSIKGCGEKGLRKLLSIEIDFENCSWIEFLILHSKKINKTQIIAMIRAGCFDYMDIARARAEYEYNCWDDLNSTDHKKSIELFEKNTYMDLLALLKDLIEISNTKRKPVIDGVLKSVEKPSSSLEDYKSNIIDHEKELMGINISCSKIDGAEIPTTKHSCGKMGSIKNASKNEVYVLVGEITDHKEFKIKNGKMVGQVMANFKLVDNSGECDCVIFPEQLKVYEGAMYDGNVIMVKGEKSNRGGIIIKECFEV